jgi:alpha-tubulin suppressor-like RCC1 family protein
LARQANIATQGQDVCSSDVPAGIAHCDSVIGALPARLPNQVGVAAPAVSSLGDDGAYSPAYLQSAYDIASATTLSGGGAGQIVAIVDAYSNPNIASDLAYYRSFFHLSACPLGPVSSSQTGCHLEVVNESGAAAPLPAANAGWGLEESIDADMVSAICPNCQILLVEGSSATIDDLGTGVNSAVAMGASVVTNSYGSKEYASEVTASSEYFNHPRVPIVVASGDTGYGVEFPAASPDVVAVGGTSLLQDSANGVRDGSSTTWSDSAGGCSAYEPKPAWQHDTGCSNRTDNDIAAVADPATGVWAYDTYTYRGLMVAGGTSVAAAIIGAMFALASSVDQANYPAQDLYSNQDELTTVGIGSDGTCATYLCDASDSQGTYNGPTGLGTPSAQPNSASAFGSTAESTSGSGSAPALVAPVLVSAVASDESVTLKWNAPTGSSPPPSGYEVLEGVAGQTPAPPPINTLEITGDSYVVSGLTNGTQYSFSVEAQSSNGASQPSNILLAGPTSPPGVPSAPQDVLVSPGSGQVGVSWSTPTSAGSDPITSYTAIDQEAGSCTLTVSSASTNSCTVSGLTNGQRYVFSVEATNALGAGPFSTESAAVSPSGAISNAPVHVTAVSGDQSASVSWGPPLSDGGSAIVSYTATDGTTHTCGVTVTTSSPDSCSITGLTNGDTYQFSVSSTNAEGISVTSAPSAPVLIAPDARATSVSAGLDFACALFAKGTVRCWGNNTYGQLGNGNHLSSATQVQVQGISGATQVSAGIDSTCALLAGGTVKCWGANTFAELGDGSKANSSTAKSVVGLAGVTELTSGFHYRCALLTGGTAKCWGYNDSGQLGNGTYLTERTPVSVTGLKHATDIVVDEDHACAVLVGGSVKCWGANQFGQLGDRSRAVSKVPVPVQGLGAVTAIGLGFSNTCGLLTNRTVKCWGFNGDGELGDTTITNSTVPMTVVGLRDVTNLAVGDFNSCAQVASGSVSCWGLNSSTALGDNSTSTAGPSAAALNLTGELTLSIDSGYSCSLLKNRTVECWVNGAPSATVLWFPDVTGATALSVRSTRP